MAKQTMELSIQPHPVRPRSFDGLQDLYFGVYTFEVEATSPWRLPRYKGSVWHGGLGQALKMGGENGGDAGGGYARLFDTEVDAETAKQLKTQLDAIMGTWREIEKAGKEQHQ